VATRGRRGDRSHITLPLRHIKATMRTVETGRYYSTVHKKSARDFLEGRKWGMFGIRVIIPNYEA